MDGEKVLDDFDTLWFFSNIFSSPPPPPPPSSPSPPPSPTQQHLLESPKSIISHAEQVQALDMEFETKEERNRVDKRSTPKSSSKRRDKMMQLNELVEFRELGFSYQDIELYGELTPMGPKYHHPYIFCKMMPPFNDGMAMKEHLKSWACAVASTVK